MKVLLVILVSFASCLYLVGVFLAKYDSGELLWDISWKEALCWPIKDHLTHWETFKHLK